MFRALTILTLALLSSFASAAQYALGGGMESRLQKEVNPDYVEAKHVGGVFGKISFWPMAVVVEAAQQERESQVGGLKIKSSTNNFGLWGRYEFRDPGTWSPFAGIGAGLYMDKVVTSFEGNDDTRSGNRGFMGLGGGLTKTFWKYLLVELEARVATVQDRNDPFLSALLRAGVQF